MLDAVLGFDAGGTSTQCAVMTLDGSVIGRGQAGPGNFQLVREQGIHQVLSESAALALQMAGSAVRVLGGYVGVAGATTKDEQTRILSVCTSLGLAPSWRVGGDMVPALAAGTMGEPGIVMIAGTGSICWGCDTRGVEARAGGWGYLLGDEGSGFHVAQQGLVAAFRAFDGRGPKTSLTNRFLHAVGCTAMPEVVGKVYGEATPRTWIASFAPVVIDAAADGDPVANDILSEAANHHIAAVLAVNRRLHFDREIAVVATGGLFQKTDILLQRVRLGLAQVLPEAALVIPENDPVVGSCYLARRAVQGDPWPPIAGARTE